MPRRRWRRRRSHGGRATASRAWRPGARLGTWAAAGCRRLVALSLTILVGGGSPAGLACAESAEGAAGRAEPLSAALRGWRVWWDDGVRVELGSLAPWQAPEAGNAWLTLKLGALLQLDASGYSAGPGLGPPAAGLDVRRARLTATGVLSLAVPVGFKLDLGVTGDSVFLNDWFLEVRDVPRLGTLRVGQVKAPFSLEE